MIVPAQKGHANMFLEPAHIMVNTVNCMGISGAGIAKEMKLRYPEMQKMYEWACETDQVAPGQLHVWTDMRALSETGKFFQIINFPTKTHWRRDSEYSYIRLGLLALQNYLKGIWDQHLVFDGLSISAGQVSGCVQAPLLVSIPALGCGNGNLDWAQVQPMIVEALEDVSRNGMVITLFPPKEKTRAGRIRYEEGHFCRGPATLD